MQMKKTKKSKPIPKSAMESGYTVINLPYEGDMTYCASLSEVEELVNENAEDGGGLVLDNDILSDSIVILRGRVERCSFVVEGRSRFTLSLQK
jgi:hypothetical protein